MRCKAIRLAVKKYNAAALAIHPPKPTLNWESVTQYSFIEELEILKDTSGDILHKEWAQAVGRATLKQWRRVLRAEEEVTRCNIEARRQLTYIHDEDHLFTTVLCELKDSNDMWYTPVEEFCRRRRCTNAHIVYWLDRLFSLEGFSGDSTPGQRTGGFSDFIPGRAAASSSGDDIEDSRERFDVHDEGEDNDDGDEQDEADIGGLIDYLSGLAV